MTRVGESTWPLGANRIAGARATAVNEGMEPIELNLQNGGRALSIRWEDGSTNLLSAGVLRANCRSAGAVRDQLEGRATELSNEIAIVAVEPIGRYAVHLAFSDGQARGIYPWDYLRGLAALEPAAT